MKYPNAKTTETKSKRYKSSEVMALSSKESVLEIGEVFFERFKE
jgi:hypothetical protein